MAEDRSLQEVEDARVHDVKPECYKPEAKEPMEDKYIFRQRAAIAEAGGGRWE